MTTQMGDLSLPTQPQTGVLENEAISIEPAAAQFPGRNTLGLIIEELSLLASGKTVPISVAN